MNPLDQKHFLPHCRTGEAGTTRSPAFGRCGRVAALAFVFVAAFGFTGCNDGTPVNDEPDEPAAEALSTPEPMQAFEDDGDVAEITIGGDDRMRFDTDRFTVRAGQMVRLTLEHTGQLPAQSMGHNVVVLVEGDDPIEFGADVNEQGGSMDNDYVPEPVRDRVIAYTAMIGGGETTVVEFKAPESPGEYPFLCSFPGHAGMMNGIMEVEG